MYTMLTDFYAWICQHTDMIVVYSDGLERAYNTDHVLDRRPLNDFLHHYISDPAKIAKIWEGLDADHLSQVNAPGIINAEILKEQLDATAHPNSIQGTFVGHTTVYYKA